MFLYVFPRAEYDSEPELHHHPPFLSQKTHEIYNLQFHVVFFFNLKELEGDSTILTLHSDSARRNRETCVKSLGLTTIPEKQKNTISRWGFAI